MSDDQFDPDAAREARDEGIERADRHADDGWPEEADAAYRWLCENRDEFTNDAVWGLLKFWGVPKPREGRALAGRTRAAKSAGLMEDTGRMMQTKRKSRHATRQPVYRSLIRNGRGPG